jgi:hypothetical protein
VSRPGAGARMTRLLAMVPWIAANDGPTIEEICTRFGIGRDQLLADLEVVWLVGLPPYTPDTLIDVVTEGDRVWIHYPDVFERPQHLTPDQGLALLAAGASVLALPGAETDGPLARGVRKLAAVLGVDPDHALEVDLGGGRPEVLEALRTAIAEGPAGPPRLLRLRARRPHGAGRRPAAPHRPRGRHLPAGLVPPRRRPAQLPGGPDPRRHRAGGPVRDTGRGGGAGGVPTRRR